MMDNQKKLVFTFHNMTPINIERSGDAKLINPD